MGKPVIVDCSLIIVSSTVVSAKERRELLCYHPELNDG